MLPLHPHVVRGPPLNASPHTSQCRTAHLSMPRRIPLNASPQMHANSREDVKEARAGDIIAIAGLKVGRGACFDGAGARFQACRWTATARPGLCETPEPSRKQAACCLLLPPRPSVHAGSPAAPPPRPSLPQDVVTGDTLCDEKAPVLLERMEFPDPVIKVC